MPNNTDNTLTVTGDAQELERFRRAVESSRIEDEEFVFDFNGTVPMPKCLEGTTSPAPAEQAERCEAECGYGNWYSWRRINWGTKWNAYDAIQPEVLENGVRYCFQTAWSDPGQWLETTAQQFPKLRFENWFRLEGGFGCGLTILYHDEEGCFQEESYEKDYHEYNMEWDPDYRDQYNFIVEGDYEEFLQEYDPKEMDEFKYLTEPFSGLEIFVVRRLKDTDLPLYMGIEWWTSEAREEFERRLKNVSADDNQGKHTETAGQEETA